MAIGADQEDVIQRGEAGGLLAAGGLIGGVLSMSCCILPLTLVMMGVSGAWIGALTALSPYQPLFVAASLAFLGAGFWSVYRRPKAACATGSACADPRTGRVVKTALWAASFLVIASVGVNLFAPMVM